jgi:hypothetical protein
MVASIPRIQSALNLFLHLFEVLEPKLNEQQIIHNLAAMVTIDLMIGYLISQPIAVHQNNATIKQSQ